MEHATVGSARDTAALLSTLLLILERAPRQVAQGAGGEGMRVLSLSETLAKSLSERIREQLQVIEGEAVSV